ncbi:hypothetical protein F2Q70_00038542 [Brassica cretica]|uniref:Uncharacterized protein n=1 Tax=Brassica cretica TaxID=69181 RepID=A0A8S9K860_BRACR|nr:hypothetical protein F2Q70_00038542 [Brassica cretica]
MCDTGASVSILPRVMADHLGLQVESSKELFTFVDCSQINSGGIVRDLDVQIGNILVPVDFHVLDIKLNWNSSLLLGRAFLSIVGAMCNLESNQLCLTLIDPHTHYNPIPVKKPQTAHQKSTDAPKEESVDSSPDDWENDYYNPTMAAYTRQNMHTKEYDEDYEEERVTEYKAILDEEDTLLHHSSWKRNVPSIDITCSPSIDITCSPSIDTKPHQRNRKRASTDIAYYSSIDAEVDRVREGDYSIGSWADDHHHESYAVETAIHEPGADEPHEGFTYEELLNMQRYDEADQHQLEATGERTRFSHSIYRTNHMSIDEKPPPSIDIHPKPKPTISENPNFDNQYLTPEEFDILQMANGADNLFMQQRTVPIKEAYDTYGGIDNRFKKKNRHPAQPSTEVNIPPSIDRCSEFCKRAFDLFGTRKFYWEEKDKYGVYRDKQGRARDVDGHIINVSKEEIRKLIERASRDEHNYICLPEHASSFTQTKLVPEIYTKDEINEMFYGVCGAQEKYEGDFQMKLDGVYHPLNDSIDWLTTCMEEMRYDIAKIQRATDVSRPTSIDRSQQASIDSHLPKSINHRLSASVDHSPPHSYTMKSQQDLHTKEEIDPLVEGIYKALETT